MGEYKLSRTVKHRVALDLATLLNFIEGLIAFCDEGATGDSSSGHCQVRISLGSDHVEFKDPAEFGTFIRAFSEWQTPDSVTISAHHMGLHSLGRDNHTRYVNVEFSVDKTRIYVSGSELFWTHQAMPQLIDQISQYAVSMRPYFLRNWCVVLTIPVTIMLLALLGVHPFLIFFATLLHMLLAAFWATASEATNLKKRWNPKNLLLLR